MSVSVGNSQPSGDLVVAVHPEYGPVMRYYLGDGYRWADAMGPVADQWVFDWRDALQRLKAAGPRRTFARLAPTVAPGQHLILIQPIIRSGRWGAPWTALIRRRRDLGRARKPRRKPGTRPTQW